ncbi:KAP family P-loop NTPase fold protein [Halalkalibacter alkaliphilus]|uniref:KAP family NTPase n=1 Tax=Halalkalibacter alkaliphilus TaxID=2917993 RepID=A0A9X2CVX1_9BACI|nr:P-loop NTPase fold protein [Halalkalibacter alkaliphilus]MCL7749191.1 KAP family NTPase [Halalkalibacter alkaliphilus]
MKVNRKDIKIDVVHIQTRLFLILEYICISVALLILGNGILTFLRRTLSDTFLPVLNFEWVKWGIYVTVGIIGILALSTFVMTSLTVVRVKSDRLLSSVDYLIFIFSLVIITNYFLVDGPYTFWTGRLLSDLFDMAMILSCIYISFICVLFVIRHNSSKKTNDERGKEGKVDRDSGLPIESKVEDQLNRSEFAEKLGCVLESHDYKTSLTIGLLGDWGTGKSSIYNMAKEYLQDAESKSVFVEFKPWYFGKDNHDIIRIFLYQLLEELKKSKGYNPQIGRAIQKYADVVSTVSIQSQGTTFSIKEVIRKALPGEEVLSLDQLKEEIESLLLNYPQKIIIYIDDIDRLEGSEVRMIFKLVRLIADFPNVTYILALDEEIVIKSLASIYQGEEGTSSKDAKNYIEKFIQVPIYLPKPDNRELSAFYSDQLKSVLKKNNIEHYYDIQIIESLVNAQFSIRRFYRYKNLIKFYLPFLKDEVNPTDLLYLLMIQTSSSDLYNFIYDHKIVLLDSNTDIPKEVMNSFNEIETKGRYREILLTLFPLATRLFNDKDQAKKMKVSEKENLERDKRICTYKFFDQYFMYTNPKESLSQIELSRLINIVNEKELAPIKQSYMDFIEKYGANEVSSKLQLRLSELNSSEVVLLKALTEVYTSTYKRNSSLDENNSIVSLAKTISRTMHFEGYIFEESYWEGCNILIIIEIHKYLKRTGLNEEGLAEIENAINNAFLKVAHESFFNSFSYTDSINLMREWFTYWPEDMIKGTVDKWIQSEDDLEQVLEYTFYDKYETVLKNHESLISSFIDSTRYLTSERIRHYFECKSPSTVHELDEFIARTNKRNIGTFVFAVNNLYPFISKNLYEMYSLSSAESYYSYIQLKSYVEIGANLICKFGDSKQKENIENALKLIADFNEMFKQEQEDRDEALRMMHEEREVES